MPQCNYVRIVGHLGNDPDVRTAGNDPVASLSIATTERRKDESGQWVDGHTEWHRIVAWRQHAETARTLHKGDLVEAIGKLHTRKWQDKDGVDRYTTEINARELYRLSYAKRQGGVPHPADSGAEDYDIGELGPPLDMGNPLSPGD